MPVSDSFWSELGRAEIGDVQIAIARFLKERCGERTNEAIEILLQTLEKLREETATPLVFLQIGEFMETVGEPPPMFAEDMIPNNTFILWSGRAKVGKSLAAYQIMEDVASGRPIFGQFVLNKTGPVLYIGMEDGKHEINRRLRIRGMSPEDKEFPIFVNTDHRDYGLPENVDALRAYVKAMPEPPALIVIDTLTESMDCVRDWNDRNQVKKAFRSLRTFAQDFCVIIGIIHNVKGDAEMRESGDEIAGSLAVSSSSDGYLSCYKRKFLPNGNLRLFVRGGGRGGINPKEFIIEMDTETYAWRWLEPEEVEQAKRAEVFAAKQKVWDKVERALLALEGEGTIEEISSHTGLSASYCRTLVKEMVQYERVQKTTKAKQSGEGGKPAPIYALITSQSNNTTTYSSIGVALLPNDENGEKSGLNRFFESDLPEADDTEEV